MALPFQQNIDGCFADSVDRGAFEKLLEDAGKSLARLRGVVERDELPHFRVPYWRDDLVEQKLVADQVRDICDTVVLFGTGGSSLGPQALASLVQTSFAHAPGRPRMIFLDNLDPHGLANAIARLDLTRTHFLVVSKSGSTAETISQMFVTIDALERAGITEHGLAPFFTVVAEPGNSLLHKVAHRLNVPILEHDSKLGGRYATLSIVGTLPALILGLNAELLRLGAASALEANLHAASPKDAPAAVGAALSVAAGAAGLSQTVMLAYGDRLERFTAWWRQLWAESLGKGGKGTTPVTALGPVDQHSQLQLYLDGPKDKLFTILDLATVGHGPIVRADLADDPALSYMAGRRIGDIVAAQAKATGETLIRAKRPVRRITVPKLDEASLGSLFMHFMLETIIAADLIGVDPFDQPAVEDSKILTRQYLAEGF